VLLQPEVSDRGVIPWFVTSVAWALGMGVEEIQRMFLGLTITHISLCTRQLPAEFQQNEISLCMNTKMKHKIV
jgi:hypothetical protein